jgi:hypothetical protein
MASSARVPAEGDLLSIERLEWIIDSLYTVAARAHRVAAIFKPLTPYLGAIGPTPHATHGCSMMAGTTAADRESNGFVQMADETF